MVRRRSQFCLLVLTVLALAPKCAFAQEQEKPPLPDYLNVSILDAIERGKAYLLSTQKPTGSWAEGEGSKFGYAALPALTLLECGVSPKERVIQAAAYFIRAHLDPKNPKSKEFTNVYEVSLALLFLDRLDNPKENKAAIEILAARLIASQTPTGGWGYQSQFLSPDDNALILKITRGLEPMPLQHLLAGRVRGIDNPFVKREPISSSELNPKRTFVVPKRMEALPCFAQLGEVPKADPGAEVKVPAPFLGRTDNSTTQFALLALWAARRSKIPVTRTGSMAFMRFHANQGPDGGWGYDFAKGGSGTSPTMINAGLLGMAIGHGIVRQMDLKDDPPVDEDPRVLNGFKALAAHIGEPKDRIKDIELPNLYFLWGLERVCLLYNVHTIGNKDWYRWGAEAIVANQEPEGNWFKKEGYAGASPTIDTCFALMFLKRANLAEDLAAYLAFSPKKLNDGVVKLLPAPPPPKVETKAEPPKVVEQKPEVKPEPPKTKEVPVQVAEAKPPETRTGMPTTQPPAVAPTTVAESGSSWIIWLVIGLGGVLIVGGALFFFLMGGRGGGDEEEEEEEEERPRKKFEKKPRRKE